MVEVTLPIVLQIVQTIALIVGIAYYLTIMRSQQRTRELTLESQELARKSQEHALETRHTQMFMQIYNESHNNPSFIDAYTRLAGYDIRTYEEFLAIMEDEDNNKASARVGMFYEGVGVLVREGYLNIRLFALLMTGMTRSWWERIYKSWIEEGREKRNFRRWMSESEYLYKELMKYIEENPELKT
ncbi:hypothetical protein E2P65_01945 [Candidatus Bathyarchaeota archaeon]|nr:hypothetical protein E2P65_01945 [Candidatus Bathyarchaeota archaeon]